MYSTVASHTNKALLSQEMSVIRYSVELLGHDLSLNYELRHELICLERCSRRVH